MAGIPQVITEDRASGAQVIEGSLKFDSSKLQYLTELQLLLVIGVIGPGVVGVNGE